MKSILTLTAVAGALALGWLALGWLAHGWLAPAPSACEVTSVTRDTIKGDSIPYAVPVPVPAVRYVALAPDTVFIGVDTAAILLAYFAENLYADTLMNDTSAFIALSETVTQNRITERTLLFQNRRPTYITTTVVQPLPRRWQPYAMLGVGRSPALEVGTWYGQLGAGLSVDVKGGVRFNMGYRLR